MKRAAKNTPLEPTRRSKRVRGQDVDGNRIPGAVDRTIARREPPTPQVRRRVAPKSTARVSNKQKGRKKALDPSPRKQRRVRQIGMIDPQKKDPALTVTHSKHTATQDGHSQREQSTQTELQEPAEYTLDAHSSPVFCASAKVIGIDSTEQRLPAILPDDELMKTLLVAAKAERHVREQTERHDRLVKILENFHTRYRDKRSTLSKLYREHRGLPDYEDYVKRLGTHIQFLENKNSEAKSKIQELKTFLERASDGARPTSREAVAALETLLLKYGLIPQYSRPEEQVAEDAELEEVYGGDQSLEEPAAETQDAPETAPAPDPVIAARIAAEHRQQECEKRVDMARKAYEKFATDRRRFYAEKAQPGETPSENGRRMFLAGHIVTRELIDAEAEFEKARTAVENLSDVHATTLDDAEDGACSDADDSVLSQDEWRNAYKQWLEEVSASEPSDPKHLGERPGDGLVMDNEDEVQIWESESAVDVDQYAEELAEWKMTCAELRAR